QRSDLKGRVGELSLAVTRGAARMRTDPGDELAMAKGFQHIVVRSRVEGPHLVVFARSCRQDEDRDTRILLPNVLEQVEAVPGTQVEVDDRDARVLLAQEVQSRCRIRGAQRRQSGLFDEKREQVQ